MEDELVRIVRGLLPSLSVPALEIGGPTPLFSEMGLYSLVSSLTIVNFGLDTAWCSGQTVEYHPGEMATITVGEFGDLPVGQTYGLVLCSCCLEHSANPLHCLERLRSVLALGAIVVMTVPTKERTFDHRREDTTFSHLLDDYYNGTDEGDLSHLIEIVALHDYGMDRDGMTPREMAKRGLDNLKNRRLHHHVFSPDTLRKCLEFSGLEVMFLEKREWEIVSVARFPP